jgi:hypothetical protein
MGAGRPVLQCFSDEANDALALSSKVGNLGVGVWLVTPKVAGSNPARATPI